MRACLLFVIWYLVFGIWYLKPTAVFAAEVPSTPQASLSPAGQSLADFLKSLFASFKEARVGELEKINQASLPFGLAIKPAIPPKELGPQSLEAQGEKEVGPLYKTAGDYAIASARQLPEKVSTNLADFFGDLLGSILGILNRGNREADKFASSHLPLGVTKEEVAMEKALPLVYCAQLPAGYCSEDKPHWPKEEEKGEEKGEESRREEAPRLDYDIPFYQGSLEYTLKIENEVIPRLSKNLEAIIKAVKKKWPTSLIEYAPEVVERGVAASFNPAFVLSIWIEETAASDVCTLEKIAKSKRQKEIEATSILPDLWQLSTAKPEEIKEYGIWDFGVITLPKTYCQDEEGVKKKKLDDQLNGFLNLVNKIESPLTFEKFMCRYSEGREAPCTFEINPGFLRRLPQVYNCLISDNPSPTTCPAGYFAF